MKTGQESNAETLPSKSLSSKHAGLIVHNYQHPLMGITIPSDAVGNLFPVSYRKSFKTQVHKKFTRLVQSVLKLREETMYILENGTHDDQLPSRLQHWELFSPQTASLIVNTQHLKIEHSSLTPTILVIFTLNNHQIIIWLGTLRDW